MTLSLIRLLFSSRALLSAALLCVALSARAESPSPILRKVDDHYNRLTTLRTRYTESYSGMGMTRTEGGTLTLRKPGRMRWAYDTPQGKLFLLDGHFAWSWTPGDAQVIRIPASKLDDLRSPLRFLLGHTQLQKELDGITVVPDGSNYRIAGVPKGMTAKVKSLSLLVDADGRILQMALAETDGASTVFTFTDQHENIPTSPAEFTFTPPPGIPVIDGTSPI